MHGTGRAFINYRDLFSAFGRWNDCVILCPLFPAGVLRRRQPRRLQAPARGTSATTTSCWTWWPKSAREVRLRFEPFALAGYSGGGSSSTASPTCTRAPVGSCLSARRVR
jgi:hypothetical protein